MAEIDDVESGLVDPDTEDGRHSTFNPDDPDTITDDLEALPQGGPGPAQACRAALREATERFPGRSRASDGIMGDMSHQARKSDHNQGNAFDVTHDPAAGCDAHALVERLKQRRDPRVKYIISKRRIWNPSVSPDFRPYKGTNPHDKHAHVSIHAASREDDGPWWEPGPPVPEGIGTTTISTVTVIDEEDDDVPKGTHVTGEIAFRNGLVQLTFDGGIRTLDRDRREIPASALGLQPPFSYPGLPPEQRQGERGFFHIHVDSDGQGYTLVGTDGSGFNFRAQ